MAAFESFDCFECSVCLELMKAKRPVVLSCLHTLCTPCMKKLYKGQYLTCPTCRSETFVPGGDVKKLPVNRDLIKIMEGLEEINRNPEYLKAAENLCQTCLRKGNRQQSAGICLQCARKLCQGCIDQHKMIGAFKDHHLITKVSKSRMGGNSCTKHNEDLVYICMTCLEAVCIDCTSEQQHVDHLDQIIKFESGISDLRKENSKLILKYNQQIEEIDLIQKDISSDFAVLNKSKEKLKDLCSTFQKKLTDTENLLRHVAESEGVLQNANKLICDKKDKASHKLNSLKVAEKYPDLAFLTHIKTFNAGVHNVENEAEIRGHTQNYTVPNAVLHDPVADDKYKSFQVATLTELSPSKSRKVFGGKGHAQPDGTRMSQMSVLLEKTDATDLYKKIILEHRAEICLGLKSSAGDLVFNMEKSQIVDKEMFITIYSEPIEEDKIDRLLELVSALGQKGYEVFTNVVYLQGNREIAEKLQAWNPANRSNDFSSAYLQNREMDVHQHQENPGLKTDKTKVFKEEDIPNAFSGYLNGKLLFDTNPKRGALATVEYCYPDDRQIATAKLESANSS